LDSYVEVRVSRSIRSERAPTSNPSTPFHSPAPDRDSCAGITGGWELFVQSADTEEFNQEHGVGPLYSDRHSSLRLRVPLSDCRAVRSLLPIYAKMKHSVLSSTEPATEAKRRFPVGAEVVGDGLVRFRVWAPAAERVEVVLSSRKSPEILGPEGQGYFSAVIQAHAGDGYRFRLDGSSDLYPDPVSRFQPRGPHQESEIVDPRTYHWQDAGWRGIELKGQVIYELHSGTFTREGTGAAAQSQLEELARIGITAIELMPVAEFDGRFGWGYDGVDMFAPSHLYGRPDDLRRFVDTAHGCGMGVLLDVVYNHFGPVGNYLRKFSPAYFTERYANEWGEAINFDGPDAGPVREFFVTNGAYWIEEFHIDGLRLDATQQIFDASDEHIITAIGQAVREQARPRRVVLVAENESQDAANARPPVQDGRGLDGVWNDDFHHSAMVALTGRAEAYYSDTLGEPQEFVSAAKFGYLFQGQYYHWQRHHTGARPVPRNLRELFAEP
jgi:maltooligosyltrehalose trehalohydrolase